MDLFPRNKIGLSLFKDNTFSEYTWESDKHINKNVMAINICLYLVRCIQSPGIVQNIFENLCPNERFKF